MVRRTALLCATLTLLAVSLVAAAPEARTFGIDLANLDTQVKPCENFYQFANGGWLKTHTLPADKSRYGAFEEVSDRNREILHGILETTSRRRDGQPGSVQQKVGDFYLSGMDEATLEKRGAAPLKPYLARIEGLRDSKDLAGFLGRWHSEGLPGGFGFHVAQDAQDSTRYLASLGQGGTALPDRDYYLKDDARSRDLRAKYTAHIARMFELAGAQPGLAKLHALMVLDLETRLAKVQWTRVELRDPVKRTNKRTPQQLQAEAPGFAWQTYFTTRGAKLDQLNLSTPPFFVGFAALAKDLPAAQWRVYLRWQLLNATAAGLSKAFVEEAFSFHGKVLNGVPTQEDRWKRIQAATDGALGEALGQLYVAQAFSPAAKQKVLEMVENLRGALKVRITGLDWMGADTKQQAIRKLDAFGVKMGYPDKWKTYDFPVAPADYFGNLRRAAAFRVKENLAKLGKPVDRTEWGMTPPTVNAYYSATMNEIAFPAGILQPPFFDPKADDAVNYGGIGWVIGHEMTHGFDDSGSQFDADGNLKNWWTGDDKKAYLAKAAMVTRQYDGYEPLPGQHVNGKLTLGENIADLGGLKIAFAAWKQSLGGRPAPAVDGFTGEQRFFLGAAQVWRNHVRDEALSVRLKTDPHSPGVQRVLGPLANLPEFYEAFGCPEGSPMVRPAAERPSIW